MELIVAIIIAIIASVPGIYANYRQSKRDKIESEIQQQKLSTEDKTLLAEYKAELEKEAWTQAKDMLVLQSSERAIQAEKLKNMEARIAILEQEAARSKKREEELWRGVRILINQIKEMGFDPKWSPPENKL